MATLNEVKLDDSNNDEMLKLDNQLCFTLYTASRLLTRAYRPLLEKLELSYPQYLVMLVLWERETEYPTVKELGESLYLDSGTLTPLLKRLEQTGYVKRVRAKADERVVHVRLTSRGKSLRKRALYVPSELFCQLQQSGPELVDLRQKLVRIVGALSNEPIEPRSTKVS